MSSQALQGGSWRRRSVGLFGVIASGLLLIALYRGLDIQNVEAALLGASKPWLVISIGMILPITVLRAVRFLWVAPEGALPGVAESLRLTLVASALNVFLPAKTGDLIKSYFVATRGNTTAGVAIAIIVYERLCDLFGLIAWCLIGWLVGRPQVSDVPQWFWILLAALGVVCGVLVLSEWSAVQIRTIVARVLPGTRLRKLRELTEGWPDLVRLLKGRRRWILAFSLLLWLSHLFQVWLFTVALREGVPFTVCASLAAIALMAGQLPLTFAGLGTRDMALVMLLSPYMPAESAAALGLLVATRNFLPPLVGLPMMAPYLTSVVGEARRWRSRSRSREQVEQVG